MSKFCFHFAEASDMHIYIWYSLLCFWQVQVITRKVCEPLEEDSFRPVLHHYDGPKFRLELNIPEVTETTKFSSKRRTYASLIDCRDHEADLVFRVLNCFFWFQFCRHSLSWIYLRDKTLEQQNKHAYLYKHRQWKEKEVMVKNSRIDSWLTTILWRLKESFGDQI